MKLESLDLNLLRVFDAVMREGSITSAGASLGQTQSSISHAIGRLRDHLGDPLFVRTTQGMRPTPYALRLACSVTASFEALREGIINQHGFDPRTAVREFTILTSDMAELLMFPLLLRYVRNVAPKISLISTRMPRASYRDAMESGAADLAIGALPENHRDFRQQHLFDQSFVCLVRSDHPTIGETLSFDQFLATPQVVVMEPTQGDMLVRRALGKRATKRIMTLRLTSYLPVPSIVASSDLIAVFPKPSSNALLPSNVRPLPLPFTMPQMELVQFWHERSHNDDGHRWLRATLRSCLDGELITGCH